MLRLLTFVVFCAFSVIAFAHGTDDWLVYKTDGHVKSNGIDLTIKYPNGWVAKEGERPHIVQKFISPDRTTTAMIEITPLDGKPTAEEIKQFMSLAGLEAAVPRGMQFIRAQGTQVEALPAGFVEYRGTMQTAGIDVDAQMLALMFVYDRSLIEVEFMVGGPTGAVDVGEQMEHLRPLFLQMANTIVMPDRWKAPPDAPVTSRTISAGAVVSSADASRSQPSNDKQQKAYLSPVVLLLLGLGAALLLSDRARKAGSAKNSQGGKTGIVISGENGRTILAVANGSPAYKAGVIAADLLMEIDGVQCGGNGEENALRLRGEVGSVVRISIRRSETNLDFALIRE